MEAALFLIKNTCNSSMIVTRDTNIDLLKSTCDSSIIVTRDTNIDLFSSSTARYMYEQMLDMCKLPCHVTKPVCKN